MEDVEKPEPLYVAGGIVTWYRHFGNLSGRSSKYLNIEGPCDPTISLLGIYPRKTKKHVHTKICT